MALWVVPWAVVGGVGAVAVAAVVPTPAPIPDVWSLIQAGGAPMAGVFFIALLEVIRRHDRAYKIIAAKDATILEMSTRQVDAIKATVEIANEQMKIAQNTELLLRELVILERKPTGG